MTFNSGEATSVDSNQPEEQPQDSISGQGSEVLGTQIWEQDLNVRAPNSDPSSTSDALSTNGGSEPIETDAEHLMVAPPSPEAPREYFIAMAKWKGEVLELDEETFTALLTPIAGDDILPKEAEIFFENVNPDDRSLIQPGAVFYWSIGYLDKPSGRARMSFIRFRRLAPWSRRDLESSFLEDLNLNDLLGID